MDRIEGNGLLCPVCRVDLVMSERQNVEIDYCPKCRGVWLDRGELDKIIEKTSAQESGLPASSSASEQNARNAPGPWAQGERRHASDDRSGHREDEHRDRGRHGGHGDRDGHGRGFLGRLFD